MQSTLGTRPGPGQTGEACPDGLCSVGLMKSLCPSCLIIGLLLLPFELLARSIRRLLRAGSVDPVPHAHPPSPGKQP